VFWSRFVHITVRTVVEILLLLFSSRLLLLFWSRCNTCNVHPGYCLCSGLGIITIISILWSGLGVITVIFIWVTYCMCSSLGTITAIFIQITMLWSRYNYYHVHPDFCLCCGLGIITAMFIHITVYTVV